jgi:hypothetical protein
LTQFSTKGFWTLSCTTKLICISSGDTPSFQAFLPKFEPSFGGGDFGGHIFVAPQIYYSQILHKIHHAPIVPKFRFRKKKSNESLRIYHANSSLNFNKRIAMV